MKGKAACGLGQGREGRAGTPVEHKGKADKDGWQSSRDLLTFHLCLQLGVYLSDFLITQSRLENRNKTLKTGQG